jgi:hypothetical protein
MDRPEAGAARWNEATGGDVEASIVQAEGKGSAFCEQATANCGNGASNTQQHTHAEAFLISGGVVPQAQSNPGHVQSAEMDRGRLQMGTQRHCTEPISCIRIHVLWEHYQQQWGARASTAVAGGEKIDISIYPSPALTTIRTSPRRRSASSPPSRPTRSMARDKCPLKSTGAVGSRAIHHRTASP